MYEDLREESLKGLEELDFPGLAIGGLSVGEPKPEMYRMLRAVGPILPEHKPHYLMGVGTPEDLVYGVAHGVDMFDCVMPTRNARNGWLFTRFGDLKSKTPNTNSTSVRLMKAAPATPAKTSAVPTCTIYTESAKSWAHSSTPSTICTFTKSSWQKCAMLSNKANLPIGRRNSMKTAPVVWINPLKAV